MTATGFRAFFPPNGAAPPPPPSMPQNTPPHLHHLLPNMRFIAQKLENPNFLPNFPPEAPANLHEEESDEVSTSNMNGQNGLSGHSHDVTNDSGKERKF